MTIEKQNLHHMKPATNFNQTDENTINQLRKHAARAEEAGTLQCEQLKIVYANNWFKMFVPEHFGGMAIPLPDALMLEEDLARIDGSLGWTVTLCAGANMFAGYIDTSFAQQVFHGKKVCLGGSGAVTGIAEALDGGGYLINGFWKYATGAPHLTHFTANCRLYKNGELLTDNAGLPLIRSFVFDKEEVTMYEDWKTMGLKATASNSFGVENVKVEEERLFLIDENNTLIDEPVYHYPFLQFAETTIAVNMLGMAEHFIDEMRTVFDARKKTPAITAEKYELLSKHIEDSDKTLHKKKEQFYTTVEGSWQKLLKEGRVDVKTTSDISLLCKQLSKTAIGVVSSLYPQCGIEATNVGTTLNRIFRDVYTGSQHSLLQF